MKKLISFSMRAALLSACMLTLLSNHLLAQLPAYVPANGLVAWYPFNGNANDESGNGNNGVVNGAVLTADRNGVTNSAYYFSGSGCGSRIDADVNTSSIQTGLTISLWLQRIGNGCISPRILEFWPGFEGPGKAQWQWPYGYPNEANYIVFGSATSTNASCFFTLNNPSLTDWIQLTYTNDGSNGRFYYNGVLAGTVPSSGNLLLAGDLALGRMNHPAYDAFNGNMDDMGIWNRALSEAEVSALYTSVPNCTPSTVEISATITEGESYTFNGQSLTAAGTYEAVLVNSAGCDSLVTLSLNVEPVSLGCLLTSSQSSICPGESVELNISTNGTMNSEPVLVDQFTMTFGGPFSRTVNTIVGQSYSMTISGQWDSFCEFGGKIDAAYGRSANNPTWTPAVLCGPSNFCMVGWNGQAIRPTPDVYNPAHSYTYPNLIANQTAQAFVFTDNPYGDNCGALNYTIYSNGASISYLWSTGATTPTINVSPTETTTYSVTVTQGDQTCTRDVTITVNQPSVSSIEATITEGETYDFNGQSLTTAGTYEAVLVNAAGCDSVVTLTLSVDAVPLNCGIEASNNSICLGDSASLTAVDSGFLPCSGAAEGSYQWELLIPASAYNNNEINFDPACFDKEHSKLYSALKTGSINRVYCFDFTTNQVSTIPSSGGPGELYEAVYDFSNQRILANRVGRDAVFALPLTGGTWTQVGSGGFDAESYGANTFWNPISQRFSYFGGYGFFAVKNWVWENNGSGWINTYVNNSNCNPGKRIGQISLNGTGDKVYIFSGQGSCAGNQTASSCTLGSPWATDVGVYCWLRDIWQLDLQTYQFTNVLPVNSQSISREGAFVYDYEHDDFYIIGGFVPSGNYSTNVNNNGNTWSNELLRYRVGEDTGFSAVSAAGDVPPVSNSNIGNGTAYYDANYDRIILARKDGIWALNLSTCEKTYAWSTGETTPSIAVAPTETTTYSVTVTQGDQSCTSDVTITVNQPSAASIEATITEGETYDFNGQTLTAAGTYEAALTNAAGCDSVVTLNLSLIEPELNCIASASSDSICLGQSSTLTCSSQGASVNLNSSLPSSLQVGLVGAYVFNGNNLDVSGSNNQVSNEGPELTYDRFGVANSAYHFRPGNRMFKSTPNTSGEGFTYMIWHKRNNQTIEGQGVGESDNFSTSGGGFNVTFSTPAFTCQGVEVNVTNSTFTSDTAVWYHYAVTKSGNEFKLYINGVLNSQGISNFGQFNQNTWFQIGGGLADCDLDEVLIYNRPLDSNEISLYYQISSVPNVTCTWSTGETTPTITVAPTETTTYSVTITQGNQTCTSDVTITVNQPSATSIEATITEGETYEFNGQSLTAAGTYEAVLTNAAGCDSVVTLTLNVEPTLTCEIDASALTVCEGEEVELTVNAAAQNIGSACSLNQLPENLRDGLVAWYPFCGNANDASGNENNCQAINTTLIADRFGNPNSAYSFDGSSSHIIGSSTNLPGQERTVSVWFYSEVLDTRPIGSSILGYGGTNCGNSWLQVIDNLGNLPSSQNAFEVQGHCNNVSVTSSFGNNAPVNQWHNWVVVTSVDGTNFYLDGVQIASSQLFINNTYVNNRSFVIGATPAPNGYGFYSDSNVAPWLGSLDDIGIWNRRLTQNEILELFQANYVSSSWSTGANTPSITIAPTETTSYSVTVTQGNQTCTSDVTIEVLANETYYADADGDGFGNFEMPLTTCGDIPAGYTLDNTDCNDGDALNYPFASCDDGDPCTIEDVIQLDCTCAGFVADSDEDGTCDASDLCQGGLEPGTPCDDGEPCTVNDVIQSDCFCFGTIIDEDNDGVCDIYDTCPGAEVGTACDDNDPCTVNDIVLADCSCAGIFADADGDGTCDANDNCAGPEAGTACDDNDPCTVNDIVLADCSCAGTFADADNDGTCDANDLCEGPEAGTACDDNDPCTVNDIVLADCSCAGIFADADGDGTCDANDNCAGPEAGTACDDNDPCTVNDIVLADCSCAGTFADADNDGTCDANDLCEGPEAGTACDDNDPCTVNDIVLADCSCAGIFADADGDGTCDANDNCAGPEAGTACDDNDPCTVNDIIREDCSCVGVYTDSDEDGVCDANDLCAGPESGAACDDNDPCTINDSVQADCSCLGTLADSDNDGVCDAFDLCFGPEPGSNCDDGNPCTINDVVNEACTCIGEPVAVNTSTTSVTACDSYVWNGAQYTASGTYTFQTTNAAGCDSVATLVLEIRQSSFAPQSVSASSTTITAGQSVTLSVVGGSLGTDAQWMWYSGSSGGTPVGQGSSISVNPAATTTYYVRAQGSCNTTACAQVTINVQNQPCGPQTVTASSTSICAGNAVTLSVTGTLTSGAVWKWYKNGCGLGTSVGTGATIAVIPTATTTYFVRAEGGSCGLTACLSITISVSNVPAKPTVITGPAAALCSQQGVVYSTPQLVGVISYMWTVPSGATIVSGQGTSSITVNFSSSIGPNSTCGYTGICVSALNGCGASMHHCMQVSLTPAAPAGIVASTSVCRFQEATFAVLNPIAGMSYTWEVPNNWQILSGQGTASITVMVGLNNGQVRVFATNACGMSKKFSRFVGPINCTRSETALELNLWPNPANDEVKFAHGGVVPEQLDIYDALGREVYSGAWLSDWNVETLESGIYFVRATSQGESVVKRLEIAH